MICPGDVYKVRLEGGRLRTMWVVRAEPLTVSPYLPNRTGGYTDDDFAEHAVNGSQLIEIVQMNIDYRIIHGIEEDEQDASNRKILERQGRPPRPSLLQKHWSV